MFMIQRAVWFTIIDATKFGNNSKLINHSCCPNCEAYTWNHKGRDRIFFFSTRFIPAGTELTYNYKEDFKQSQ